MPSLNDALLQAAIAAGATSTSLPSALRQALAAQGVSTQGTLNDMWMQFLAGRGFSAGSVSDRMLAYLGSQGLTGSLNDRLLKAAVAGTLFIPYIETIPSLVDYFIWSDTSRLRQNSDGTGLVTAVNDPVGWWRGQRDVLTMTQATTGNKPSYASDGIAFIGDGVSNKKMVCPLSMNEASPFSVLLASTNVLGASDGNGTLEMSQGVSFVHALSVAIGWNARIRMPAVPTQLDAAAAAGKKSAQMSYDGASAVGRGPGTGYADTALAIGAAAGTIAQVIIAGVVSAAHPTKIRGFAFFSGPTTAADRDNLQAWAATL